MSSGEGVENECQEEAPVSFSRTESRQAQRVSEDHAFTGILGIAEKTDSVIKGIYVNCEDERNYRVLRCGNWGSEGKAHLLRLRRHSHQGLFAPFAPSFRPPRLNCCVSLQGERPGDRKWDRRVRIIRFSTIQRRYPFSSIPT